MGRPRKTEAQRRAERFGEHYRVGKARAGLKETQIAEMIGVCPSTLRRYKQNPDLLNVGLIIKLGKVLRWSDDEYLSVIHPER